LELALVELIAVKRTASKHRSLEEVVYNEVVLNTKFNSRINTNLTQQKVILNKNVIKIKARKDIHSSCRIFLAGHFPPDGNAEMRCAGRDLEGEQGRIAYKLRFGEYNRVNLV